MEKTQFVNFIVTILEETGFKVYKDYKAFQHVIDIYAVLPTIMGDFTMVIACKNYDEEWKVGLDIIKEMEMAGRVLKTSKVVVATTSNFSPQARTYASEKKIKLLDRDNLIILAKKFSKEHNNDEKNQFDKTEKDQDNDDYSLKTKYESQYYNEQYENDTENLNLSPRTSQTEENYSKKDPFRLKKGRNSNKKSSKTKSSSGILNQEKIKEPKKPLGTKIKILFNNSVFLIFLVVTISYLISLIIYKIANVPIGIQGLIKILSSLILSYGIVFAINPKGTAVLLKGTIIFFVSLIISILMIIFL